MLFFSSVWYQFALISSTILLLLSQQWKLRSMFPPAQSGMIYHCADTSWATKRNSRAFWLFAAANNLLLKQKESWEDWRKDTAKGYFSISELSLWWGPISDNWIHLVLFYGPSKAIMLILTSILQINCGCFYFSKTTSKYYCKLVLPFSFKWCLAALSGSQCRATPDGMSCRCPSFILTWASSEAGRSWWNYTSRNGYLYFT